jgi:hypothetical protein
MTSIKLKEASCVREREGKVRFPRKIKRNFEIFHAADPICHQEDETDNG